MTLIECNRPSKLVIYTIVFLLALIVESLAMEDIPNNGLFSSVVIAMFFNLCGILAIIPERIVHMRSNYVDNETISRNNNTNDNGSNDSDQIPQTSDMVSYDISKIKRHSLLKTNKKFLIFLYLVVSFIDITTTIVFSYGNYLRWTNSILSFSAEGFQIFLSCLFCSLILKYKIERHKKVSLGIILLSMILNSFVGFSSGSQTLSELVLLMCNRTYMVSFTALQEVLEKYMMTNYFQNNFFILFVESVLGEIYAAIMLLVIYLSGNTCSLTWVKDNKSYWSTPKYVGRGLLFSLACIPYSNMRLVLARDFLPTDRIVADKVGSFYFFIYYMITAPDNDKDSSKSFEYYVLSIIAFTSIIIGSVIYNETIVLKFWNLDKDTTKEIESRKLKEHESLMKDMMQLSNVCNKP